MSVRLVYFLAPSTNLPTLYLHCIHDVVSPVSNHLLLCKSYVAGDVCAQTMKVYVGILPANQIIAGCLRRRKRSSFCVIGGYEKRGQLICLWAQTLDYSRRNRVGLFGSLLDSLSRCEDSDIECRPR